VSKEGSAGGGVPNGGVMFYTEDGKLLLPPTNLGSENIIYTISADNITKFKNSFNNMNPKASPITYEQVQLLANNYASNSYSPMVMANGSVLGNINAPWYMHVAAALSIMGEGYAMGRTQLPNANIGLKNHYSTSAGYGIKNYWINYYTPKRFNPWW
jgi:hypothetical protein